MRSLLMCCFCLVVLLGATFTSTVRAADNSAGPSESDQVLSSLKQMSFEELMGVEVMSVSRRLEPLSGTASAIQVITDEQIRRSGAVTLPETLRLAPNLQVAQTTANNWAITARGFNGTPFPATSLANKLLVMIDGRSIYNPLFAGVYWDVQHVLLEDIDRIEVISGPGGTLWGANAVNGVINIVSKSAQDTQGAFLTAGIGSELKHHLAARYGGKAGDNLYYRVYAQSFDHLGFDLPNGAGNGESWDVIQAGFRLDYAAQAKNEFTLQGDLYEGRSLQPVVGGERTRFDGQNIIGRWSHAFSDESDWVLQVYFDRARRNRRQPGSVAYFMNELRTLDLDFQHRLPLGQRHNLVWGAGYRRMRDEVVGQRSLRFGSPVRIMELFSGFVQDEISLIPDKLSLILGSKFEHNAFTGFEYQPSGRMRWTPNEKNTLWASVSRAVRSPSRLDVDQTVPIRGNPDFVSEELMAYEIGYRLAPVEAVSMSLSGFFHDFDKLRALRFPPFNFVNGQEAELWGMEFAATWQVAEWWRLRGGFTLLNERFKDYDTSVIGGTETFEAIDPDSQAQIQSMMNLPGGARLDFTARYVDDLPASSLKPLPNLNVTVDLAPPIPAYVTFDARVAWEYKNWEFSITGQNLDKSRHEEFGPLAVPRSVYGRVVWRY